MPKPTNFAKLKTGLLAIWNDLLQDKAIISYVITAFIVHLLLKKNICALQIYGKIPKIRQQILKATVK